MYIKIKHIKQILLITICFFLAGFNYLTYAKADNRSSATNGSVCDKSIDSDCDDLTNAEEKLYSTDENNSDTDGDGYSDGVEVKSGYDPTKAAPGDKLDTGKIASTDQPTVAASAATVPTLTDNYLQDLNSFISSKDSKSISTTDIKTFSDEQLIKNMGDPVTLDTLPDIDRSQIKILKQSYSSLSDTDRKQKEAMDAVKYVQQMAYLLLNNSPTQISSTDELSAFMDTFSSHLSGFSGSSEDSEYFSDLGNRLEVFLNQAIAIEVPETMVDMHIKFLRIANGILTLRDCSLGTNDPMGKMILMQKASAYVNLVSDFFKNDFQNYFNKFN